MGDERTFVDIDGAATSLEAMVNDLDVATLSGPGATRLAKRLVTCERVLAACRAKAMKRATDANQWRTAGERSPGAWVAKVTGTTLGQATAELETTAKLEKLPITAAARAKGEISELQAKEIAGAATADPAAEAELLRRAKVDDAAALKRRCAEVRAAAERDEAAAREKIRKARRFRSWTDAEGAFCFAGRGLAEDGAALLAAMKGYQDAAFHTARRAGERESTEAYAYDALMAMARHDAAHECPAPGAAGATTEAGHASTGAARTTNGAGPGTDPDTRAARSTSGRATRPSTSSGTNGAGSVTTGADASGTGADTGPRSTNGAGAGHEARPQTVDPTTGARCATTGADAARTGPDTGARSTNCAGAGHDARPQTVDPTIGARCATTGADAARTGPDTGARSTNRAGAESAGRPSTGEGTTGDEATRAAWATNGAGPTGTDPGTGPDPGADTLFPTEAGPGPAGPAGPGGSGAGLFPQPDYDELEHDRDAVLAECLRPGPRAKLIVRIDHSALLRGHTVPGEVCEIVGVGPVPVATARELARDAFLTAVVTDGVDIQRVVHLGRSATAHQRTALEARGVICAVPGCGYRHGLEIDHVDGWAITRRTHISQLDWLCQFHHGQKTHHSYRLAGPPGARTWHPPNEAPDTIEPATFE